MARRISWRQILKRYASSFSAWLNETDREYECLDRLATFLSQYLISRVESATPAREFWGTIPEVRRACNEARTYERPWAAEAYAFVHLLERYRRMWSALKHLTATAVLPLGARGVRALDIGTGPAASLYAIDDY